jgi:hypothetical protein
MRPHSFRQQFTAAGNEGECGVEPIAHPMSNVK